MNFYEKVLTDYIALPKPKSMADICKIDGKISYYLADQNKTYICAKRQPNMNLFYIDIRGAYPTICKAWFGQSLPKFISDMEKFTDKRSKLIFISNTLKPLEERYNKKYLSMLAVLCRTIILGIISENCAPEDLPEVLELKKDGILVMLNDESKQNIIDAINGDIVSSFTSFFINNGFEFHISEFKKYIRCNGTSHYVDMDDNIETKGTYKDYPPEIKKYFDEIILGGEPDLKRLQQMYSEEYYKICKHNNLYEILKRYYLINDRHVLDVTGKLVLINTNPTVEPHLYLKTYLFPAILSNKL